MILYMLTLLLSTLEYYCLCFLCTETVILLRRSPASSQVLPNPNALVAVNKGMRPVKLCTNRILQLLTEDAG